MNTLLISIMHTSHGDKKVRLVSICAWCPSHTFTPLKSNQAYTHGICAKHKAQLLKKVKLRH